jgi:hypothetical protein
MDDLDAGRSERREMDAGAACRSARFTTARDQVGYLEDGYTHLFVVPRKAGHPTADERQVERRVRRASRGASDRLDADSKTICSTATVAGRRHAVRDVAAATSSTSRRRRFAIS